MSVILQIHAWIHALHVHLGVHRHVALPLGWIISGKVVRLALLRLFATLALRRLRAQQIHPQR